MRAETLAELRDVLPGWVTWAPLGSHLVLAGLQAWMAVWLALLLAGPGRLPPADLPWTERARRSWPARVLLALAVLFAPVSVMVVALVSIGPLSVVPGPIVAFLSTLVAEYVVAAGSGRYLRRLGVAGTPGRKSSPSWPTALVMYPARRLALGMACLVPATFGPVSGTATGLALVALAFFAVGGGVLVARWLGLVQDVAPEALAAVERAAADVGTKPRAVYSAPLRSADAMPFPFLGVIAFTERALELLDEREVQAIASHELGHLAERGATRLKRLQVFPFLLVGGLWRPIHFHAGALGLYLALVAGFVLMIAVATRQSRKAEHQADAHAHRDREAYVRALEKLQADNLIPAVLKSAVKTHPDLWDRIEAAGLEPSFSRPAPASAGYWRARLLAVLVVLVGGARLLVPPAAGALVGGLRGLQVSFALEGGERVGLERLGLAYFEEERYEEARVVLAAEVEVKPRDIRSAFLLAETLARLDERDEARRQIERVERDLAEELPASALDWIRDFRSAYPECFPPGDARAGSLDEAVR